MDYWYSINGDAGSYGGATWGVTPCHRILGDDTVVTENYLMKITQITDPARLVFIFDGIFGNVYNNVYRINGRHSNATLTNVSFFDGHAETLGCTVLPGGHGSVGNDFSLANLANFPGVHWCTDQTD